MELKCKRCKHKWNYKGQSKWYVSCPKCRTTIRIKEELNELKQNKKLVA